jgi:hypothetical protein
MNDEGVLTHLRRITEAICYLTNRSGSYQGMTSVMPNDVQQGLGFSPCKKQGLSGAKAQVIVGPVAARLKTCPDTKQFPRPDTNRSFIRFMKWLPAAATDN